MRVVGAFQHESMASVQLSDRIPLQMLQSYHFVVSVCLPQYVPKHS